MDQRLQAALQRERRIKSFAVLSLLAATIAILLCVDNLLVSFVLAFVMNYLLAPIVDVLERRGVSRHVAVLFPFLAAAALIFFGVYKIFPLISSQASLLESNLPTYQSEFMTLISGTAHRYEGFFRVYNVNFTENVNNWIIEKTAELSSALPSAVSRSLTVMMLSPFFAFFMLKDGRSVSRTLLAIVPNPFFEMALTLQHQLNSQMGGFIRARFFEGALVGAIVWIGLQLAGFPYAVLLGAFAGITNLIPYVGPILGAVPALIIALVSKDAMVASTMSLSLIFVTSIYFIAQMIDAIFIIPMVVAKIVNLHPVSVIIVIIVGAQVMGILGMIISIPVASATKLIFQTFYSHLMEFRT